jgi:beta-mannosidase
VRTSFTRACLLLTHLLLLSFSLVLPSQAQTVGAAASHTSDLTLDGADWRMASFAFGEGVRAHAFAPAFVDSAFHSVVVPGDTQLQAGFAGSERFEQTAALLAVNQKEWWYRKHFRMRKPAHGLRARLVFEGVDYFTTAWLNGHQLGSHEGTYTTFSFDVTELLSATGENVLAVQVAHPWIPPQQSLSEILNGDFSLSAPWVNLPLDRVPYFTEMHWDALPAGGNAAYDMGIWRPVHVVTEPVVSLRDIHAETLSLSADGSAVLRLEATISNASNAAVQVTIPLSIAPANFTGVSVTAPSLHGTAAPGESTLQATFTLPAAHLWWSWDQGPQDMYLFSAALAGANGSEQKVRFGVRTVSRDTQDMTFRLNGRRIFLKGSFFPIEDYYRATPTAEDYERDLRLFRDANFNLVTSLTVVEKPEFYNLCDELGLLLVDQLPFPQFGPMQVLDRGNPRREPFLALARETTRNVVLRLRSHPSVVEWAPLAEAHDKSEKGKWGANGVTWDQEGYNEFIAQQRKIVTELAPGEVFHPSLCDLGEQHFWMAAAGLPGPDATYQEHFDASAGFVSEYGSISMSNAEHLDRYLTPEQQWNAAGPPSPPWLHLPIDLPRYAYLTSSEYEGLWSMLWRTHHAIDAHPGSAADLVRDTQAYHAFLMRYAAQAYRRKKYEPIMGMRSWCFLELAPGFRFGLLDYDRVPKAAYYAVRKAQAPVAISFAMRDALAGQLAGRPWATNVYVINDLQQALSGTLEVALLKPSGAVLSRQVFNVSVAADGKVDAGAFGVTLPTTPGAYILEASLMGRHDERLASERIGIKVVPPITAQPLRVLSIGQSTYAAPVGAMLRNLGAHVTALDENSILQSDKNLGDAASLHSRFDVIWLSRMDGLAKLLPASVDRDLLEAVRLGTGLVHTGGKGSFHGGWIHAAVLEGTQLSRALPVSLRSANDIVPAPHDDADELLTKSVFSTIRNQDLSLQFTAGLLQAAGLSAYNAVTAKPDAATLLTVNGDPLLVQGKFGRGSVAVYTGFTPVADARAGWTTDERLSGESASRAYFAVFSELLARASSTVGTTQTAALLQTRIQPLFELLSTQPRTKVTATTTQSGMGDVGSGIHVRTLILKNEGAYAHAVHLRVSWKGKAPFYTSLSDNDFDLLAGETRIIRLATKSASALLTEAGECEISGANVESVTTPL